MKLLAIILALAVSQQSLASLTAKEAWRAKAHRDLVHCAGFYAVSINFFKEVKPQASRDAADLKSGAIYFVSQLRVSESESDRHLAEFSAVLERDYNYPGAYPKLFGAYAKKCDAVMNSFAGQYTKHYGSPTK